MIPGPGEPTDDQIQNFLRPMVDELIVLYDGVVIPTYQCPNGVLVRVALMSVNCDIHWLSMDTAPNYLKL
ncbi:hypothetical protein G6F23_015153 [Rhizopus arrhizus]|nr:hypothetical protein G6F23_015153 [Rhizopus arrhizus]